MTKPVAPEEPDVAEVAGRARIEEIARGLTDFQRRMILGEYNPELTGGRLSKVWRNLRKRGLAGAPYQGLTPLGLAVRAYLLSPEPSSRIP